MTGWASISASSCVMADLPTTPIDEQSFGVRLEV